MVKESEKIFNFMDLDFQDITRNFIYNATHPKTNEELPHNVHIRDPQTVISKWKTKLKMDEITKIQNSCKEAMKLWGYNPIKNINEKTQLYTNNFSLL